MGWVRVYEPGARVRLVELFTPRPNSLPRGFFTEVSRDSRRWHLKTKPIFTIWGPDRLGMPILSISKIMDSSDAGRYLVNFAGRDHARPKTLYAAKRIAKRLGLAE